jgi:hypothetical protein
MLFARRHHISGHQHVPTALKNEGAAMNLGTLGHFNCGSQSHGPTRTHVARLDLHHSSTVADMA